MSKIKEQVTELLMYYSGTRQVGHTTAMMRDATNNNALVVAHNKDGADLIKRLFAHKDVITLGTLNRLKGTRQPLLLDNATLHTLFIDILQELEEKEELEIKLNKIKRILND